MLNILDAAPTILVAVAQILILAALGILFGTLENTTDKEFKEQGLPEDSFRSISSRTWALIIGMPIVVGAALFCGDFFYENALVNWLMLIVVVVAENAYFVWVVTISDRIREMVTGVCLLVATWPAFCRLGLNLLQYAQVNAIGIVRLIVLICVVAFVCTVIARIHGKDKVVIETFAESEGE